MKSKKTSRYIFNFLLISIGLFSTISVYGGISWTGGATGDWAVAANWSGGAVPIATSDVTIGAGKTVTVSTTVTKINSLIVNGKLIISGTGNLNVEQTSPIDPLVAIAGGEIQNNGTFTIKETLINTNLAIKFSDGAAIADTKFTNTGIFTVDLSARTVLTTACISFTHVTANAKTAQFVFGGTVNINVPVQSRIFELTSGNATFDGTYTFGNTGDYKNWRFIQFIAGNFNIASTGNIEIYSGYSVSGGGTISSSNSKDVVITNNGIFALHGGPTLASYGIYMNPQNSNFNLTINNYNTFTVDGSFPAGAIYMSGGAVTVKNTFNNKAGATASIGNTSSASSPLVAISTSSITNEFNNAGTISFSSASSKNVSFGASNSTFNNSGTVNLTNTFASTSNTLACIVNNNSGGVFNFNVSDNTQTAISSTTKITFNNNSGGKITGRGLIGAGNFFPQDGSIISPGGDTGIGLFTFLDATMTLKGKCIMNINGKTAAGGDYDQIITNQPSSTLNIANATLEVTTGGSYIPTDLDIIPLFNSPATRSGFFANVTLPANWATQYTSTNANVKFFNVSPSISVTSNSNISSLEVPSTSDINVSNGAILTVDANSTIHNLTIEADGKVTNTNKSLTVNNFTINSDVTKGTGTYVDLNPTGGLTIAVGGSTNVQQYLKSGRNWYVSSPVTAATGNVLLGTVGNKLWQYNEVNADWTTDATTNSTPLTVMKGFVANTIGDGVVTFTGGTLNTGNKSITVNRTENTNVKRGFNLVGNPYPSYVNARTAINTTPELEKSMWYRTKNQSIIPEYVFDTYNTALGTGTNLNELGNVIGTIPPMQAVWVRVADTYPSAILAFTNSLRSHKSDTINPFKTRAFTTQKLLRLQVSNDINNDEALVVFNDNASNNFDAYDSHKMMNNNNSIPEIYTLAGSEIVVINGLKSMSVNESMPLGFTTGVANNFTIKATEVNNFDADTKIILKDNLLNTEQDITDGTAYSFSSDVTSTSSRFSLLFKSASVTTGIGNTQNLIPGLNIFKNANNLITINRNPVAGTEGMVSVRNSIGQLLVSTPTAGTSTVIHKLFVPGVYLVKVSVYGKQITKKVIIN